MNKQIMGIFPEPLARYTVWSQNWQDKLLSEPTKFHGNHSYSINTQVLDQWPDLKKIITDQVNDFAHTVLGIKEQLAITQSWINIYEQDQDIHRHNHPNSIVSGTWFWSTPADSQPFAVQTNSVRVAENDLVIWPSYLQHSTVPHTSTEPRRTLSFNSMPKTWGSDLYQVI